MLRLENIYAGYGKRNVLHDITLHLEADEIVALVGPNGAGKSTVLKVAAGFLDPNQGHVRLEGKEIKGLTPHERVNKGIAYCIQGGRVFPSLSVLENMEMGATGLSSGEAERGRERVLNLFPNLKSLLDRKAGVLSGGERQALALGMVLVRRPRVLLLDEPSAGLSPNLVRDMLDRVLKINEEWETAVLLVEQHVREALKVAHRGVALVSGEVTLETEQPEDWISGEELEDLFFGRGTL